MKLDEIKEIMRLMSESDISELSIEKDGTKVSLRRGAVAVSGTAPAETPSAAPREDAAAGPAAEAEPSPAGPETDGEHFTVVAPMVGTFYRAPAPDADPYVEEGDVVDAGQPLCIIEAMKLMNEIESEVRGRILRILVDNGQPVEYGQTLFVLEKA